MPVLKKLSRTYKMATTDHRPVLIVIAGPNGSGKTSVTSKILHHEWLEDSEYINPDNVAKDLFGDWNNQESVLKAANFSVSPTASSQNVMLRCFPIGLRLSFRSKMTEQLHF